MLIVFMLGILLIGVNDASATIGAGSEYEPTQLNAHASYNTLTNQVQVSWNFNATDTSGNGAPTTCLLKGDLVYGQNNNVGNLENNSGSFIPRFYSTVTTTPTTTPTITYQGNNPATGQFTEIVTCTGSMRIDIDTLMNHSENINNYPDLMIFLTFYVPDPNGNFNGGSIYRIDEVFIFYSPVNINSNSNIVWACGGQIGSTLYIDPTGIHGSNGDNCDGKDYRYFEIESNQWVDIGMKNSGSHHTPTYGYHNEPFFSLLKQVFYPIEEQKKKSNGGSCADCEPPWLGMDSKGIQRVSNGVTINDSSMDAGLDSPLSCLSLCSSSCICSK